MTASLLFIVFVLHQCVLHLRADIVVDDDVAQRFNFHLEKMCDDSDKDLENCKKGSDRSGKRGREEIIKNIFNIFFLKKKKYFFFV